MPDGTALENVTDCLQVSNLCREDEPAGMTCVLFLALVKGNQNCIFFFQQETEISLHYSFGIFQSALFVHAKHWKLNCFYETEIQTEQGKCSEVASTFQACNC